MATALTQTTALLRAPPRQLATRRASPFTPTSSCHLARRGRVGGNSGVGNGSNGGAGKGNNVFGKRGCFVPRAGPSDNGGEKEGTPMNTNILYERMKALQAKETAENSVRGL